MKRTPWRVVTLVLCFAIASVLALAQNPASQNAQPKRAMKKMAKPMAAAPTQSWHSISIVRVKPDMVTEWQDLQKNVVNKALRKAGVKERGVFETAVFGNSYEYVIISPIASFAQYDEPMSPLRKALGDDAWRDYVAKSRRCIVSVQTFADLERPDLSYMGGPVIDAVLPI